jgi:YD repeat-containing protein
VQLAKRGGGQGRTSTNFTLSSSEEFQRIHSGGSLGGCWRHTENHEKLSRRYGYGYDNDDRLTGFVNDAATTTSYTYDADGNRTSTITAAGTTTYHYPTTSNRLASLSGLTTQTESYDASGNQTGNGTVTYAYDARGRMSSASTGGINANALSFIDPWGLKQELFAPTVAGAANPHLRPSGKRRGPGSPIASSRCCRLLDASLLLR